MGNKRNLGANGAYYRRTRRKTNVGKNLRKDILKDKTLDKSTRGTIDGNGHRDHQLGDVPTEADQRQQKDVATLYGNDFFGDKERSQQIEVEPSVSSIPLKELRGRRVLISGEGKRRRQKAERKELARKSREEKMRRSGAKTFGKSLRGTIDGGGPRNQLGDKETNRRQLKDVATQTCFSVCEFCDGHRTGRIEAQRGEMALGISSVVPSVLYETAMTEPKRENDTPFVGLSIKEEVDYDEKEEFSESSITITDSQIKAETDED